MLCLSYYVLCFLFNKIRIQETRGQKRFCPSAGGQKGEEGKVVQPMYTHLSKCKNDKIKNENKKE
jgi:hypothetical protein